MEYLSRLFPPTCSQQKLGCRLPSWPVCTRQRGRGLRAEVGARQFCTSLRGGRLRPLPGVAGTECLRRNRTAASDTAPFTLYKEPITVLISWATPEGGQAIHNPEHRGRILNSIGVAVSLRGSLPYHISKLLTKAQNKTREHPGELQ